MKDTPPLRKLATAPIFAATYRSLDPSDPAQEKLYLIVCAVLSQYCVGNEDAIWEKLKPLEDDLARQILEQDLNAS